MTKIKKNTSENFFLLLLVKNFKVLLIPRPPERTYRQRENPPALKREHPALQKIKFTNCFPFFRVIFALLDPDPIRIQIHNTA
jgi:hypothetical protein